MSWARAYRGYCKRCLWDMSPLGHVTSSMQVSCEGVLLSAFSSSCWAAASVPALICIPLVMLRQHPGPVAYGHAAKHAGLPEHTSSCQSCLDLPGLAVPETQQRSAA